MKLQWRSFFIYLHFNFILKILKIFSQRFETFSMFWELNNRKAIKNRKAQ